VTDIRVPKLNNNDQTYTLVEWLAGDEEPVEPGAPVATLETSKAAEELVCDDGGVLRHGVSAGTECEPGTVIGWVVAPGTPRTPGDDAAERPAAEDGGPVITRPARARMDELGVDAEQVRALDQRLVRAADIDRLAGAEEEPARTYTLPAVQRAVGRMVTRSRDDIPAAYSVMRIDVGAVQEEAGRLGRRLRKPVGLPEFLIAAVAPLYERFPLFFATPEDERTVRLPDDAHIGLTIDVGKGLFVPVIKNASARTVEDLVAIIKEFRLSAANGTFREQDLSGGNLSIALHHTPGVVLAIPFVFPGQTCCLALTSARPELVLDAEGGVSARTVADLGLAYDHRFVNGGEAVSFLEAVKETLEATG
jgi:2-oxoglutarate dehydrogenase E2 component (dihydrolipoamide succinyltransferase)